MSVITRFAPSPTGHLHIGGLRSALFSYAWAKKNNGKFLLRLEDTDRKRFVKESLLEIPQILQEFGLNFDNKLSKKELEASANNTFDSESGYKVYTFDWVTKADYLENIEPECFKNSFIQSQRLPLYQYFAWQLIKKGYAYFCFCSPERLQEVNKKLLKEGKKPGYDGYCKRTYTLDEALEKIKEGQKAAVRFNIQKFAKDYYEKTGTYKLTYKDTVVGEVTFDLLQERDFVILKSDGFPTYHLAVVIDDHFMGVTDVIRGYEWISSVPKHLALYEVLGFEKPRFVHLPVILDPSGGKLSKRKGAVAVVDFLKEGYLKEAILNFLMFLGFNPIKDGESELLTLEEFVKRFDVEKIHKSNPVFNREKLLWFNKQYMVSSSLDKFTKDFKVWLMRFREDIINKLTTEELYGDFGLHNNPYKAQELIESILADLGLGKKLAIIKERTATLWEALKMLVFFYIPPKKIEFKTVKGVKRYDEEVLKKALREYREILEKEWPYKTQEEWANRVREIAQKYGIKPADFFMAIRLVVCGYRISPPLWEVVTIMDIHKVSSRINMIQSV